MSQYSHVDDGKTKTITVSDVDFEDDKDYEIGDEDIDDKDIDDEDIDGEDIDGEDIDDEDIDLDELDDDDQGNSDDNLVTYPSVSGNAKINNFELEILFEIN